MKLIILITIFCIAITTCMAAVSRGVFKDPNHPGKCVLEGLILSHGENGQHPTKCEKILCGQNSEAQIHSCGAIAPPPGHKAGETINPKAPYPGCCDKKFVPI